MSLDAIKPYAKAFVGFVAPGVASLVVAVQDASQGGSAVTGPEWIGIGAACLLTGGAVFATPNRDPRADHQDESVQPPSESYAGDTKVAATYHPDAREIQREIQKIRRTDGHGCA
jgi:hypothetical protein